MLKILGTVATAAGLAVTGLSVTAGSAHAAPHAKGSIYVHGTRSMTNFPSRSTCGAYAKWAVAQVGKSKGKVLPGYGSAQERGPELRTTCYPVQGGRWTYLIGYRSATGSPAIAGDRYINPATRDSGPGSSFPDGDNVWIYEHFVQFNAKTTSMKTCNAHIAWALNQVAKNPNARLGYAWTVCDEGDDPGTIAYDVGYLATAKNKGIPGDRAYDVKGVPMLELLGYDYGQMNDSGTSAKHLYRHR